MEKLGAVGLIIPPGEYRAMRFADDDSEWEDYAVFLFEREIDELCASGENIIGPGEVEDLLLEYSKMVNNET